MRLIVLPLKRDLQDALRNLPEFNLAASTPILKDGQSSIQFAIGEKVWKVGTDRNSRFSVSWKLKDQNDVKGPYKE